MTSAPHHLLDGIFESFISRRPPPESVLVGYSGGPDSTALLLLFRRFQPSAGYRLLAGHLDHCIRAESSSDADFCRSEASALGVPFVSGRADVPGLARNRGVGIEEAARFARYDFLLRTAAGEGCGWVALGHNAEDQAETILMRIVRGTGIRGLAGIRGIRPARTPEGGVVHIARPLLSAMRKDILDYLSVHGARFVLDASNEDESYTRNRARRVLFPLIEKHFNPSFTQALNRLGSIASSADSAISSLFSRDASKYVFQCESGVFVSDAFLESESSDVLSHLVIERAFDLSGVRRSVVRSGHFESVATLLRNESGSINVPGGVLARRIPGGLFFSRPSPKPSGFERVILNPGSVAAPEGAGFSLSISLPVPACPGSFQNSSGLCESVDSSKVVPPFLLRPPEPGDRFNPLGLCGTMRLKKFLNSLHVSPHSRSRVPLLLDSSGRIFWVGGYRISDFAKVGSGSLRRLELRLKYLNAK